MIPIVQTVRDWLEDRYGIADEGFNNPHEKALQLKVKAVGVGEFPVDVFVTLRAEFARVWVGWDCVRINYADPGCFSKLDAAIRREPKSC